MKVKEKLNLLKETYSSLVSDNSLEAQFQKELYLREIARLTVEDCYSWSYRNQAGELVETSLYALSNSHLLNVAKKCLELDWARKYLYSIEVICERFPMRELDLYRYSSSRAVNIVKELVGYQVECLMDFKTAAGILSGKSYFEGYTKITQHYLFNALINAFFIEEVM
jgi:hypothetical protein